MNERLVEDWLAKANERLYQTPFAQSLIADGMEVLRVAHNRATVIGQVYTNEREFLASNARRLEQIV